MSYKITASVDTLMRQAGMTVQVWFNQAEDLCGIKDIDQKLKFAEICAVEFSASMKSKVDYEMADD